MSQKGGGTIDLEPRLTHTSAVEPTLAPVSVERTMTTRAAASVIAWVPYFNPFPLLHVFCTIRHVLAIS